MTRLIAAAGQVSDTLFKRRRPLCGGAIGRITYALPCEKFISSDARSPVLQPSAHAVPDYFLRSVKKKSPELGTLEAFTFFFAFVDFF